MGVVGRLDQYASMLAGEFDETTANGPTITGLGTYYASEFNENIVETATIVTSGLILNLDAGNPLSYPGSGTTWTDISGSGNNGTLTNGPTYSSDNGGFFTFNGTNNEVTTTTQFTNPQTFSIGAWFKTSSASGKKIIGFENAQTGTGSFQFDRHAWIGSDGKLNFGIWTGSATIVTSPLTYNDNNWHYVVGTYGGEGTTMRLYVDGVSVATNTGTPQNTIGYWRIAGYKTLGWPGGSDGYFPGSISNAVIYNRGITAAEVSQNYNALLPRYTFLSANVFSPYDLLYDDFGGTLFGAGQGRYMRQNTDKSVIVYNEIDEITDFAGTTNDISFWLLGEQDFSTQIDGGSSYVYSGIFTSANITATSSGSTTLTFTFNTADIEPGTSYIKLYKNSSQIFQFTRSGGLTTTYNASYNTNDVFYFGTELYVFNDPNQTGSIEVTINSSLVYRHSLSAELD
jgi:hypothetical protein